MCKFRISETGLMRNLFWKQTNTGYGSYSRELGIAIPKLWQTKKNTMLHINCVPSRKLFIKTK